MAKCITPLKKPVTRRCNHKLGGRFGADGKRRLIVTLIPGTDGYEDTLAIRPEKTRRTLHTSISTIYHNAVVAEVHRQRSEKRKARKSRKS